MSVKIEANILFIGCSGVGKSSLLNYMFNRKLEETGVGKPCTGKGIFPHTYEVNRNFKLHIYDSWGLEPDKAEEWKKMMMEEIRKHDTQKMSDWFNTIFFLISVNNKNVQDFEVDMIKELKKSGNEIVVVFTHCKNKEDMQYDAMKKRIMNDAGMREESIVCVNSVEAKPLGKKDKIKQFGKEKLFVAVEDNLWRNIYNKVPNVMKNDGAELIQQWAANEYSSIEKEVHFWTNIDKASKRICDSYQNCLNTIEEKLNKRIQETNEYYHTLKAYLKTEMEIPDLQEERIEMRTALDTSTYFKKKFYRMLSKFVATKERREILEANTLIDFWIEFQKIISNANERKESLREGLKKFTETAQEKINLEIERIFSEFLIKMQ